MEFKARCDFLGHVEGEEYRRVCKERDELKIKIEQHRGALGYSVPGNIPNDPNIRCGLCDAKSKERDQLRAELELLRDTPGGKRLYAQYHNMLELREKLDVAVEALEEVRPALKIAFEDYGDRYYENVLNDLDESLLKIRGGK